MKTKGTDLKRLLGLVAVAMFLALALPQFCLAEDYYWIGGSGDWSDPSNWSPSGPPESDDSNAYLTQSDSVNRTVTYNATFPYPFLTPIISSVIIDATGTGTMTFNMLGGGLYAHVTIIGSSGAVTANQSGGEVHSGDFLRIGANYNMSEGSMGVSSGLFISGTFNHTGGSVRGGDTGMGVDGTYNLSGATANVSNSYPLHVWGTFNQSAGTVRNSRTYIQNGGTYNLSGGSLDSGILANQGTFNYSGGALYLITTYPTNYGPFINSGSVNLYGSGIREVNSYDVVNNGTFKTTHTTAAYTGTFTNNGAYISDPATQYFNDLIIGQTGYLVGQYKDYFYINGNFINHSAMKTDWNTMHSYLSFITGEDILHDFYLTGVDYGAAMSGYSDNFSWGTLDITGNSLYLFDGDTIAGVALYLRAIDGLDISGNQINNIFGIDGLNIYYMANLKENDYLGRLVYDLSGGGHLIPIQGVPEPSTMLLLGSGLLVLVGLGKRFRK